VDSNYEKGEDETVSADTLCCVEQVMAEVLGLLFAQRAASAERKFLSLAIFS